MKLWPLTRLFGNTKHPAIVHAERYFLDFDPGCAPYDCEFVVLDSELTGLNFRKDEMVSVAAVRIKKLRIVLDECFYSFLRTRQREATSGTFIHRITPQQIRAAPDPATVIPELVNFCGTAILVGHCLDIDLGFLNRATRRLLGAKIPNMSLDTAILVRAASQQGVLPGRVHSQQDLPNDLNRLAKSLNLPVFQHHDALEDALQTAYLFLFLVEGLRRAGYTTLSDLRSLKAQPTHDLASPAY